MESRRILPEKCNFLKTFGQNETRLSGFHFGLFLFNYLIIYLHLCVATEENTNIARVAM